MLLVAGLMKRQTQDDAGRNGHQHIVAASLNPVVTSWWPAQVVPAPVIHNILIATVFPRETPASMHVIPWACPTSVLALLPAVLGLSATTTIMIFVMGIALRECGRTC